MMTLPTGARPSPHGHSPPRDMVAAMKICEAYVEHTYSSHLGLLRACRQRPDDRSPAKQRNELASLHKLPSRAEDQADHGV
jgi:hypothetical protein